MTTSTPVDDCGDDRGCEYFDEGEDTCSFHGFECSVDAGNIYVNETLGFSFQYPEDYRRVVEDEGEWLIHKYWIAEDTHVRLRWGSTMFQTFDMMRDDLFSLQSEYDVEGLFPFVVNEDTVFADQWALDWEVGGDLYEERNLRFFHPNGFSKQYVEINALGSCSTLCPGYPDPQWDEVVAMIEETWQWFEPAEREVSECGRLGGGIYRVEFPPGEFGTVVSCSAFRGDFYLFRLDVGEGQTMSVSLSSLEDNAVFGLSSPSGTALASESMEIVVSSTEAGTYEIAVGGTRGNASFDLTLDVR